MTPEQIAGLEALLEQATPGEWSNWRGLVMASGSTDTYGGGVLGTIARANDLDQQDGEGRNWWASGDRESNASLIALAPTLARQVLTQQAQITALAEDAARAHDLALEVERLKADLRFAEAALADIGDAEREEGDDIAWCERRAAKALPRIRATIRAAHAATAAVLSARDSIPE